LAETVIVRSADVEHGLLIIKLENVIPEEKLPRKILIGGSSKLVIEQLPEAA
jgi:molecular chaperone IbpA